MKKNNKLILLMAFTIFLGCPLVEKPNNIKPSSSPTPAITTTPTPSASILDNQPSNNIKLEKFDGKLVFLSSETPKDLEANSLYFLDGDKPIPRKIFTFSTNSNFNRFLISPDEKKVFILNVPSNQVTNTAPSSNNLGLYIFDLESNNLNKITFGKDLTLGNLYHISWFPNSSFLAIKDESNAIYVFDIKENKILLEHKLELEKKDTGLFILPDELNSNFTYFLTPNGYSFYNKTSHLWKIYSDRVEKINIFIGYSLFPNVSNNTLLIHDRFDYDKLRSIDINSGKITNIIDYNKFKELNEIKEKISESIIYKRKDMYFTTNKYINDEIIITVTFYWEFDCCPERIKEFFLFNSNTNKLESIYREYDPIINGSKATMISKLNLLIDHNKVIDINKKELNLSLSDFFKENLSYESSPISSIYSN